jgi:cyclic pyranopterin phosphate synthase
LRTDLESLPKDTRGRPLRDLRVSVTDRCNFRCSYCMPREVFGADFKFLKRAQILSFEEIDRIVTIMWELGVRKVRLTGGEPLLRADLHLLVEKLASHEGMDVALTTNGALLEEQAGLLAQAGLGRVTVSLDSLDEVTFQRMNDAEFPVTRVLSGIEAAKQAGLSPVKINVVVVRGVNDHAIVDMARHFQGSGHVVRFIEYMDVGNTNGWHLEQVVTGAEILERLGSEMTLEPLEPEYRGEVAKRWRHVEGGGEIGIITSVSQPFCGDCTRARLSADGNLHTCLFSSRGFDLRVPLRDGSSDDALRNLLVGLWSARDDRYSEVRSAATEDLPRVEMSYIGG